MRRARASAFLFASIFVLVLSAPAFAQAGARLRVCNTGSVPLAVGVATTATQMASKGVYKAWFIKGDTVAPGGCALVYDQAPSTRSLEPGEALIGFGFRGGERLVSLRSTSVPDLGTYVFHSVLQAAEHGGKTQIDVLSRDARTLCVDPVTTPTYMTEGGDLPAASECAGMSVRGGSHFLPLTTAYYFFPDAANYYLNVTANPAAGEVAVTGGLDGRRRTDATRASPRAARSS